MNKGNYFFLKQKLMLLTQCPIFFIQRKGSEESSY